MAIGGNDSLERGLIEIRIFRKAMMADPKKSLKMRIDFQNSSYFENKPFLRHLCQ